MEVPRRGLRLLNTYGPVELKKTVTKPGVNTHSKPSPVGTVQKPVKTANQPKILKYPVYVDPVEDKCQHCGSQRPKKSGEQVKETKEMSVQVNRTDLNELLCSVDPSSEYWESIAEERRVALKETLDENKQLCELVEKLNLEIDRLNSLIAQKEST
uniref:Geminin n=1 Tax=Trichobilharzia regenti TaxID=157069 RepID=A0AA85J378_TRIRE|nr:unnamed protein product [Trichobilharzia regenti]